MSFILKQNNININAKISTYGRKLLASGLLTFKKWAISDDEVNYTYYNETSNSPSTLNILRPKDKNPDFVYFIKPTDTATSPYTPISNLIPVETTVKNSAKERGFFTGNTANGFTAKTTSDYVRQTNCTISLSACTSGTTVSIKQGSGFVLNSEPSVNDLMLVQWTNPKITGTTTNGVINKNVVSPYLWYKVQSKTGTISGNTLTVTVDRNLPNFSSYTGSTTAYVTFYPGGDSINSFYGSTVISDYWNQDTLSFDNSLNIGNDDINVWNLSIVYSEDIAGKQAGYETFDDFNTSSYNGFKNYINSVGTSQKSLAILHYSNNTVSNFYGEQFFSGSTVIDLPTVIWHKTPSVIGVKLRCLNTTTTKIFNGLNTPYYDLYVDDTYNTVVGKCFPNLKMVIIENEELVAALSYKSNRNYTLPSINDIGNGMTNVLNPAIFTNINQRLYVSYLFETHTGYSDNVSYGYKTGLHNQNYTVFKPETNSGGSLTTNQICRFTIDSNELGYLYNNFGYNTGNGFTFGKFKLIYQLVNNSTDRPTPSNWKEYDFTTKLSNYSSWSGSSIPSTAFSNVSFIIDNNTITGGTTYDLNNYITIPTTSQPDNLQFGDECFLFGNFNTDISATVFKSKFLITLPYNNFNVSSNPTYDSALDTVYISSMGIYDDNNNLVAVGKLNTPIEKKNNQTRLIELTIDF